ncbi:hypothetical protein B0H21DRAFT_472820 [Amylocystis lapponica]|nr:hypothetical protein B0H21DRAFT_472820 [Amylocystis lapponica]
MSSNQNAEGPTQYGGQPGRVPSDTDNSASPVRIPRRTPVACQFCRGRKLKCDGRQTCANCHRRGIVCVYVPVQK